MLQDTNNCFKIANIRYSLGAENKHKINAWINVVSLRIDICLPVENLEAWLLCLKNFAGEFGKRHKKVDIN